MSCAMPYLRLSVKSFPIMCSRGVRSTPLSLSKSNDFITLRAQDIVVGLNETHELKNTQRRTVRKNSKREKLRIREKTGRIKVELDIRSRRK
jgi:hypothetical protein